MDTIVFDIETQNFFTNPGVGWNNFGALKISVVGAYSYNHEKYFCFQEDEMDQLAELFRNASRIVGFCSNHYDTPVLNLYFRKLAADPTLDLWKKERVDLLDEIEGITGSRISLNRLAKANLGIEKTGRGWEAIGLWERGEIEKLKEYCLNDVRLTKDLYDLFCAQGYLLVPNKESGETDKIVFPKRTQTLFPAV